jgi:tetratricopeptide (TPR) repeat protein
MRINSLKRLILSCFEAANYGHRAIYACLILFLIQQGSVLWRISENPPQTYAIVIGISEYKEINNLEFADDDARLFSDFLLHDGIDSAFVYAFYNETATFNHIALAMESIVEKAAVNDQVLFYFAGHGANEITGEDSSGNLLLYDSFKSNYNAVRNGLLPISYLEEFAQKLCTKGAHMFMFADACYAGQIAEINKNSEQVLKQLSGNWCNTSKILSCQAKEKSIEGSKWGGGHGVFTFTLVNLFRSGIDYKQLPKELQRRVFEETNGKQTPYADGKFTFVNFAARGSKIINISAEEQHLYALFNGTLTQQTLLEPAEQSAFYYCKQLQNQFPQSGLTYKAVEQLTDTLLWLPQNIIDKYVKEEIYINFFFTMYCKIDSNLLKTALQQLTAALDIIKPESMLYKQTKAKKLCFNFLVAAEQNKEAFEKNRHYLDEAIALDPSAVLAHNRLGLALLKYDVNAAKVSLDKILQLAPNWSYSYNALGMYYNFTENSRMAITCFNKGKNLNANNSFLYSNLAYLYYRTGQYDKALLEWKAQSDIDLRNGTLWLTPKDSVWHYMEFALCYMGLQDIVQAEQCLKEMERISFSLHSKDKDKRSVNNYIMEKRACLESIKGNMEKALNKYEAFFKNLLPDERGTYTMNHFTDAYSNYYPDTLITNKHFIELVNKYCPASK